MAQRKDWSGETKRAERIALDASMALRAAQIALETFNNDLAVAQQLALSKGETPPAVDSRCLMELVGSYRDARAPWCRAMDQLQAAMDAEREGEAV